ncbi:hypothetical protein [uncultured Croceitalea sp.]|uniref:hypothetical protein n=1 Tax=uncultured Croceitalea sp. TaxID=1798908 RepID=UPI003305AD44
MIIYGYRSTHLKTGALPNVKCPNCGSQTQMTTSVYGRHVHIFWIPLFPAGKIGVFECQHCHKGFKKKALGQDAKLAYKNFKTTVKTPIWKYSGLMIIALLVALGFYSSSKDKERVQQLVKEPAMFDVYTFRTEQNYYSTFKVSQVFEDSIYVNYNNFETNKLTGVKDIDKKENYQDSLYYVLTVNDIKALEASGDLMDVCR